MSKRHCLCGLLERAAFISLTFAPLWLAAQTNGGGGAGATGPAGSVWKQLLPTIIACGVPIVIAVAKIFVPSIPKVWLPIAAPILGAAADFLVTGTFGQGTILGALAGSAGVGLREICDQIKQLQQK